MENREIKPSAEEPAIEAELVSNGPGDNGRYEDPGQTFTPPPEARGVLTRMKAFVGGMLALFGAGLLIVGALLTYTVIGAIIGIPMMLAGAAALYLFFKLMASGPGNIRVFRNF
ncbi:MAG TPA: hypothetical protein DCZ92_02420 [Elusimicrobia bacterium]|nr:MAG: hypothetical protein A2016_00340 [Elusimicrobia bacterium GWF2_62_30]HBA59679.1 hypothetical protein [Elusimicrobiota bacterium]